MATVLLSPLLLSQLDLYIDEMSVSDTCGDAHVLAFSECPEKVQSSLPFVWTIKQWLGKENRHGVSQKEKGKRKDGGKKEGVEWDSRSLLSLRGD